jgi:hypothetical protein
VCDGNDEFVWWGQTDCLCAHRVRVKQEHKGTTRNGQWNVFGSISLYLVPFGQGRYHGWRKGGDIQKGCKPRNKSLIKQVFCRKVQSQCGSTCVVSQAHNSTSDHALANRRFSCGSSGAKGKLAGWQLEWLASKKRVNGIHMDSNCVIHWLSNGWLSSKAEFEIHWKGHDDPAAAWLPLQAKLYKRMMDPCLICCNHVLGE